MDADMDFEQGGSADALAIFQEEFNAQQRPTPPVEHDRKMLYVQSLRRGPICSTVLTPQSDLDLTHPHSDLVFVQDCTGSQGSYISSATKNIQLICDNIYQSGKLQSREDLRVGLVAYRDHPPQDHTYVTRNFGFSSDIDKVHRDLSSLYASGGGDGPEAVTAGLAEALKMDWREHASKMIVLIADAPPHGVGEYGDGTSRSLLLFFAWRCRFAWGRACIYTSSSPFGNQDSTMGPPTAMTLSFLLDRWPLAESLWYVRSFSWCQCNFFLSFLRSSDITSTFACSSLWHVSQRSAVTPCVWCHVVHPS